MYQVTCYSKTTEGYINITEHFRVREFKCNDGSDVIFISKELAEVLEDIRMHFSKPVIINSGYRTVAYNTSVEGSSVNSMHCKGIAADIYISGVKPREIYDYLIAKYPNKYGIGLYKSFVHVDVRLGKARW